MPNYEIEIREQGRPTVKRAHTTPDGEWYDTGHVFEFEGQLVEVALLEETDGPTDQRLVVTPV